MYKYEPQRKNLTNHSSGSVERKGTIEFKRDLSAQPKVNVQKAMGISENSANKNSVFIQRAEMDRRTIQFAPPRRGQAPRSRRQPQPQPQPQLQPQAQAQPEENPYEITVEPDTLQHNQKRRILDYPTQSPIGGGYYHIEGRYPDVGKPIWKILPGRKIEIVGMYRHGKTNRKYKKNKDTGDGPKYITI